MTSKSDSSTSPSPESAPPPRKRIHRLRLFIFASAAALAIAGTALYTLGPYDAWRDGKSLDEACQGLLPKNDLRSLMGVNHLRGGDSTINRGPGAQITCSVVSPGKSGGITKFSINWGGKTGGSLEAIGRSDFDDQGTNAVPIGGGWAGVITSNDHTGSVSTVSQCRGSTKNLTVNVSSYPAQRQDSFNTPRGIGSLARVATETMMNAAKKWGCDAKAGIPVESVTPPLKYWDSPSSVRKSSGTCRPISPLASEISGVEEKRTIGTPAGKGLIEDCLILDAKQKPLYRLAAFYEPYSLELHDGSGVRFNDSPAGNDQKTGSAWASAECKDFFGTARFTFTTERGPDGVKANESDAPDLPTKLLKAFAKDAAQRHACSGLSLP
ncbi:hypothetical protein [Streptomyces sp. NPDC051162]|uniref:hypothetical protein n=1 Tax=Streptomyces sp. NPDC051162 TaxID=3154747 RepID=UPI0034158CAC